MNLNFSETDLIEMQEGIKNPSLFHEKVKIIFERFRDILLEEAYYIISGSGNYSHASMSWSVKHLEENLKDVDLEFIRNNPAELYSSPFQFFSLILEALINNYTEGTYDLSFVTLQKFFDKFDYRISSWYEDFSNGKRTNLMMANYIFKDGDMDNINPKLVEEYNRIKEAGKGDNNLLKEFLNKFLEDGIAGISLNQIVENDIQRIKVIRNERRTIEMATSRKTIKASELGEDTVKLFKDYSADFISFFLQLNLTSDDITNFEVHMTKVGESLTSVYAMVSFRKGPNDKHGDQLAIPLIKDDRIDTMEGNELRDTILKGLLLNALSRNMPPEKLYKYDLTKYMPFKQPKEEGNETD